VSGNRKCGIIVVRQHQIVNTHQDYFAECILEGVHGHGPHVFCTPEGEYYAWEDDMECGCCEPEEEDGALLSGRFARKMCHSIKKEVPTAPNRAVVVFIRGQALKKMVGDR
jgi:hypothetical protein